MLSGQLLIYYNLSKSFHVFRILVLVAGKLQVSCALVGLLNVILCKQYSVLLLVSACAYSYIKFICNKLTVHYLKTRCS